MAKNWMQKLTQLDGFIAGEYNPHTNVLRTPSPSLNFIFGNAHGLPAGYSVVFWGPPKGGKSICCNLLAGYLHQTDPEAVVVKFDTEMREEVQMTSAMKKVYGIDSNRYIPYSVNTPDLIFDRIAKEIAAMCDDGMPLKLVIIDSMNAIRGRRAMNSDTVMTQQIGDNALTNKTGLQLILSAQRKHRFALAMTSHVGAELDPHEQMRGNKIRMAQAFGVQHHAEYFVLVEQDKTKAGKTDLAGNAFEDDSLTDLNGNAERTAHKIRCTMKDSSLGPKGRVGCFTFNYTQGIVNQHEEIFQLAANRGVLVRPSNRMYQFGDRQWDGKEAMCAAIKGEPALANALTSELMVRDMAGAFKDQDKAEEQANAEHIIGA